MSMSVRSDDHRLEWAGALGFAGLFPTWRNARAAVVPADAGRDPALPPDGEARCWPTRPTTARDETLGVVPGARPVLAAVPHPLHGVAGRLRVVLRPGGRAGLPGALPVHLPAAPRHARRSSARRSGAPSPAARGSTSRSVAARLPDVRTGTKVTSVLETPTGVEITDGNGQVDTFDAVVVATHPGQALAMLAEPTSDAARGALGDAVLAQHRPAAHRHQRAARATTAPGRRGTTCAGRPTTAARSPSATT